MVSYSTISEVYDIWQESNDTDKWVGYAKKIIKKHLKKKTGDGEDGKFILLDLGCGTGNIAIKMAKAGYEVIGVDKSPDMLSVALEKDKSNPVQFACMDITNFELYGTVDIIICFLDTVNHLTTKSAVRKMLSLCKNYLNKGGIIIFDIATQYYFEEHLGDNTFFDIRDEFALIWENSFYSSKNENTANLTFFVKDDTGRYIRSEEVIREKIYHPDDIMELINSCKLEVAGIYSDFTFTKPGLDTERIFFVAENKNDSLKDSLSKNRPHK